MLWLSLRLIRALHLLLEGVTQISVLSNSRERAFLKRRHVFFAPTWTTAWKMPSKFSGYLSQPRLRLAVSLLVILGCVFAIWITGQAGFSRLLGKYAALTGSLEAADRAVELSPSDPQSHRVRATILYHRQQLPDAASELERAISLRPGDDYLWLELGIIRDELEDSAGALIAFDEAVRLAPYYAIPRWQRGNLLLRMGRLEEAFMDLRVAAASKPDLIPSLLDLAWSISEGDSKRTQELAQITTSPMRIAFAGFLTKQGKAREALDQAALAGNLSEETRHDLVRQLISANAFKEGFEIWTKGEGSGGMGQRPTTIYDGGFERPLNFDELGFGWRMSRSPQGVLISLDSTQPQSGSSCLRLEFTGYSNPSSVLVSQFIIVEPGTRYRVYFAARTQDVVTGGVPLAIVSDATAQRKRLGQSAPLRRDTTEWQSLSFDFQTESATPAVHLRFQREGCTTSPCPIFGSVWLDSFSIEALK